MNNEKVTVKWGDNELTFTHDDAYYIENDERETMPFIGSVPHYWLMLHRTEIDKADLAPDKLVQWFATYSPDNMAMFNSYWVSSAQEAVDTLKGRIEKVSNELISVLNYDGEKL